MFADIPSSFLQNVFSPSYDDGHKFATHTLNTTNGTEPNEWRKTETAFI